MAAQPAPGPAIHANGSTALLNNRTGGRNVATGVEALYSNSTGNENTALGTQASLNTTGSRNVAVGAIAGSNVTTGSFNVFLGAWLNGDSTDTNTMRLGLPYDSASGAGQNRTFIAGSHGTQLTGPAVQVFVEANGQLGTPMPPGTVSGGVTPGAAPPSDAAVLSQRLEEQRRLILDLQARLAILEAEPDARSRRR
jgi:hypothetical protein